MNDGVWSSDLGPFLQSKIKVKTKPTTRCQQLETSFWKRQAQKYLRSFVFHCRWETSCYIQRCFLCRTACWPPPWRPRGTSSRVASENKSTNFTPQLKCENSQTNGAPSTRFCHWWWKLMGTNCFMKPGNGSQLFNVFIFFTLTGKL